MSNYKDKPMGIFEDFEGMDSGIDTTPEPHSMFPEGDLNEALLKEAVDSLRQCQLLLMESEAAMDAIYRLLAVRYSMAAIRADRELDKHFQSIETTLDRIRQYLGDEK